MSMLIDKPLIVDMDGVDLMSANAKGYIQVTAYPSEIKNYKQHRAPGARSNIAAIRVEGDCDLTVRDFSFKNQENGILTDASLTGILRLRDGEITDGSAGYEQGKTHLIYVGEIAEFIAERVTLARHDYLGHLFKSRALKNTLTDCVIDGGASKHSRCLDFPRGGHHVINGGVITQSTLDVYPSNPEIFGFSLENRGEETVVELANVTIRGNRTGAGLFRAGGPMTWIDGGGNTFTGVSAPW